jgi:hypothetical protein
MISEGHHPGADPAIGGGLFHRFYDENKKGRSWATSGLTRISTPTWISVR